jgi:hypothetical protein
MWDALSPDNENHASAQALMSAVEAGDAFGVGALLAAGGSADASLPNGETPLMRAASRGYADVSRALLDAGADVNARRGDGFTPLILAVFFGHEEVVRLLLGRGADASARTRLGTTARKWAASRGFDGMAELLRGAEATRMPKDTTARPFVLAAPASGAGAVAAWWSGGMDARAAIASQAETIVPARDIDEPTASIPVRREDSAPSYPSASRFRLGEFSRSWQASVGTAMLLLAFCVGVYAVWRNSSGPSRENSRPETTQSPAPQAVAQPPAPSAPVSQPSPALPTPDAQSGVPGATYVTPNSAGPPLYVPPPAPMPGQANAPTVPVVVSESDAQTPEGTPASRRKPDAAAREKASSTAPDGNHDDAGGDESLRSGTSTRNTRAGNESQSAPPAKASTPPPAPTPSAPSERRKVIQWPPQ